MSSTSSLSQLEILNFKSIVSNFRVNDLHILLSHYHYPKLGKKQELVGRAHSLLDNSRHQQSAVQKIKEIQARYRRPQPDLLPTQTSSSFMHHQNQNVYLPPNRDGDGSNWRGPTPGYSHQFTATAAVTIGGSSSSSTTSSTVYHHPHTNTLHPHPQHPQQHQYTSSSSHPHQQQHYPPTPQYTIPGAINVAAHHIQQHLPAASSMFAPHPHASPISIPAGQLQNLRTTNLPFYDELMTIIPLTLLPPYNNPTRPGEARSSHQFGIPSCFRTELYYRKDEQPLPRTEIQFRMFLLDLSGEQPDAFPPGCILRVDGVNVTLPNVIPTNKPNAEQKRLSRPVNLTPYCQPPGTSPNSHTLYIEWMGDKRAWAFGVFIVKRLNSKILLERVISNKNLRRSFEQTKRSVIDRLSYGDDDGIQMDKLNVSLLDPLGRTRIEIPSRAKECTHLQCFDLNNYLMMNEKRPSWKCPVCSNNAIYSNLIVDCYYERLLQTLDSSVDDVELLKDGSWRTKKVEAMSLSSGEDDDIIVVSPNCPSGSGGVPSPAGLSLNRPTTVSKSVGEQAAVMSSGSGLPLSAAPPDLLDLSDVGMSGYPWDSSGSGGASNGNTSVGIICDEAVPISPERDEATTHDDDSSSSTDSDIICLDSDEDEEYVPQGVSLSKVNSDRQSNSSSSASLPPVNLTIDNQQNSASSDESNNSNNRNMMEQQNTSDQNNNSNISSEGMAVRRSARLNNQRPAADSCNVNSARNSATNPNSAPNRNCANPNAAGASRGSFSAAGSSSSSALPGGQRSSNGPSLFVNGVHHPSFRPVIDEVAKKQIAQNLAEFIQHIFSSRGPNTNNQ